MLTPADEDFKRCALQCRHRCLSTRSRCIVHRRVTSMDSQTTRAEAFQALHERAGIFVIPNPWDAGSAKMLAMLGFEALATTSAGLAFSIGKPDAQAALGREETLVNSRAIVDATSLPVSADLENGFGDDPSACA